MRVCMVFDMCSRCILLLLCVFVCMFVYMCVIVCDECMFAKYVCMCVYDMICSN